jgi:ribosome biogenesis protein ENP2
MIKYNKSIPQINKDKIINSVFDFNFPSLIKKIKQTEDGSFLIAYGEYPPQIRCFDLNNLSLKFQRTINCEVKDFQIISQNWEKLILLRSDKFLEFHSKAGYYYQIKIPNVSNSLFFDNLSKILYIFSTKNEIFRFNVQEGKFISSIISNLDYYNTSSAKSFVGNLIGLGNSKGLIELWDFRVNKKPVSKIDGLLYLKKKNNNSVSSLSFNPSSIYKLYSGFASGDMILYDLRNLNPIISKKMGNGLAIKTLKKNQNNNLILCADQKIIKLWNEENGKTESIINPKKQINHVCHVKNTGFVFISTAEPQVDSRYIPLLGPLPVWCCAINEIQPNNFRNFLKIEKVHEKKKKIIKIQSCLENLNSYI